MENLYLFFVIVLFVLAIIKRQAAILNNLNRIKKKQIKLIKSEAIGTRNSMLVLGLLAETKNLLLFTVNMIKAHRDFVVQNNLQPVIT